MTHLAAKKMSPKNQNVSAKFQLSLKMPPFSVSLSLSVVGSQMEEKKFFCLVGEKLYLTKDCRNLLIFSLLLFRFI